MPYRSILALALAGFVVQPAIAAEPSDFLDEDGRLRGPVEFSHVQEGGFAGLIANQVSIAADGTWSGTRKIGGRSESRAGKLDAEALQMLASALASNDFAALAEVVGAPTPVRSPREVADGASGNWKLTVGERTIRGHAADGVKLDADAQKQLRRLSAIASTIQKLTLNAVK